MKATTHTEIYRPFEGTLATRSFRFLTIAWSGIRLSSKKKLPLLFMLGPPAIVAITFSFIVYARYALEKGEVPGVDAGQAQLVLAMAGKNTEVAEQIVAFLTFPVARGFALLTIAWFGAGMIAEDRRLGAHLLYFSRPITRLDYLLGKFLATAWFGALALLVPAFMINMVAAFSSPDWSYLTEQWDIILKTIAFSAGWIALVTALVLVVSSLVERKTLALAAAFGLVFLTEAVSNVLAQLTQESSYRLLSLFRNTDRVAAWAFDRRTSDDWSNAASLYSLSGFFALTLVILWWRVRRMEEVA
jgi:ABC-type transport system involved in multi-copper enzyme maturation permease subunit